MRLVSLSLSNLLICFCQLPVADAIFPIGVNFIDALDISIQTIEKIRNMFEKIYHKARLTVKQDLASMT